MDVSTMLSTMKLWMVLLCALFGACDRHKSGNEAGDSSTVGSVTDAPGSSATGSDETDVNDPSIPKPEVLYRIPGLLDPDSDTISAFDVNDNHIYFQPLSMVLYRVPKDGKGQPELFSGVMSDVTFDAEYAYTVLDESLFKVNKQTLEQQALNLAGQEKLYAITTDSRRLYVTNHGCTKIVTMSMTGEDVAVFERETPIVYSGRASIIVDETNIYCSGSAKSDLGGRLYRCPKEGGEITEVTTMPDANHEIRAAHSPQVSGMAAVGDQIYFIGNFADGANMQYLYVVPKEGGEPRLLAELRDTYYSSRLHYDEQRNSLYFFAPGKPTDKGVYRWVISTQSLTRYLTTEGDDPLGADNDYLYWSYHDKIYRMKKF